MPEAASQRDQPRVLVLPEEPAGQPGPAAERPYARPAVGRPPGAHLRRLWPAAHRRAPPASLQVSSAFKRWIKLFTACMWSHKAPLGRGPARADQSCEQ